MKAVIMAGGGGTRLRPLTHRVSKCMVPILNRPLLHWTIDLLRKHNFSDLIFLLHYLPESVTSYFGDGRRFGVNIQYIEAEADYGTAGAVRLAKNLIESTFVVFSGDVLTNLNLSELVRFHKDRDCPATLAITKVDDPRPFGSVEVDSQHRIRRFIEKPASAESYGRDVNAGIYVLEREIFEDIPDAGAFYFARDLFPGLLRQRSNFCGFSSGSYWRDIGNPDSYRSANLDVLDNRAELTGDGGVKSNEQKVIVGGGSELGPDVTIRNSIIGESCRIGHGCSINNTVLWSGVVLGSDCRLDGAVVAESAQLGHRTVVERGAVVGQEASIGPNCHIHANVKVNPYAEIAGGVTMYPEEL